MSNELIQTLRHVKSSLRADQRPGVKVDGQKISKEQTLDALDRLETYFGIMGSLTLGICKDCTYWTLQVHHSLKDSIGTCKLTKSEQCSCYGSCYKFKAVK